MPATAATPSVSKCLSSNVALYLVPLHYYIPVLIVYRVHLMMKTSQSSTATRRQPSVLW